MTVSIRCGSRRRPGASLVGAIFISAMVCITATVPVAVRAADTAAPAANIRTYDIPAGPLEEVLNRFGRQADILLSFPSDLVEGLDSKGLQGRHSVAEALDILLGGHELEAVRSGDAYVLRSVGYSLDSIADSARSERLAGTAVGASSAAARSDGREAKLPEVTVVGEEISDYVARRNTTAVKTDTPISEAPQSVSVITREQMDARDIQTVGEALAYSAGVSTEIYGDSSGLGGDNISIRGFGGSGTAGASRNEYWDGLRVQGTNFAASSIDTYLFERIEILRGPASVLYGQNQPGGVVNRASKRPPQQAQGQLQVRGGSFDAKELDLDVGGPLTEEGTFSYRLIGVVSDEDAQTDFTSQQRQLLSPSLSWQPTTDTNVTLQAVYQHDDNHGKFIKALPAYGTVFDTPNGRIPRDRFTGDPNYDKWDREMFSLGYFLEHRFNETWSVRQNARYYRNELDLESIYITSLLPDGRTVTRSAFGAVENADVFSLDNQAEARFGTGMLDHTLLLGVDWQRRESDTLRRIAGAPTLDLYDPVYHQDIQQPPIYQSTDYLDTQVGLYVQDQIKLDRWILTLGGRYDWADSETTDNFVSTTTETDDTAFTGRVGLGYAFANGLTPYVSYAESFEPQGGTDFFGNNFEPTAGEQYEAGIKYEPSGYNAFVTLSAFELKQQNVLTPDPEHPGFGIQTGEIRSRGIELEGVANLDNGWSFIASYSYLDQEVTESNANDLGKRPEGIPKHKAALWSDYKFDAGTLKGLGIGAGVRYIGTSMGDSENTFSVSSYTLLDAALKYDLSAIDDQLAGLSLAVNGSNLTDKTYVSSCIRDNRCYYGIGRTVFARLKYDW